MTKNKEITAKRNEQKKKSRLKNDITTIQLSNSLKVRLVAIQNDLKFDKQDDALEEVLDYYEENKIR